MKGKRLIIYILIALILGIIFGGFFPEIAKEADFLAIVFLNMIKMIIAPLLFSTLVVGIAGHGDIKNLGRIGLKTIIYFEIITTIALFIGLSFGHLFRPGDGFGQEITISQINKVQAMAASHHHESIIDMIISMVPTSIFDAMSTGNLLQIVIFSIFFAIAICSIGEKAKPFLNMLTSLSDIMFKFTELVMCFAPIGIFGAIASTVAVSGFQILENYAKVIFTLYIALVVFVFSVLIIACRICKVPFKSLLMAISEPALLAFSTASSEAALPKAMDIMEKFGVPKNIVGFVMPTGYTFNLDGSTLYLALGVLFSTQIMGIDLTIKEQLLVMLALMLTSKGIAGVPRLALIVMAGTLSSFNYPLIGVALLLPIDHILDMGRTTVNLIGNCVATVVIARWEKDFDYQKMENYINLSNKRRELLKKIRMKKEQNKKIEIGQS